MSRIEEMMKELCPEGVEYRKLGDCCKIETGRLNANAAVEDGEYPFFTTAQEVSHIDSYRWDTEALLIAGNANVGDVKYYKGKFEAYQRTYVLTSFSQGLLPKFLFYVLKSQLKPYLEDHKHEAAMTYIVLSSLQNFEIPVPPLAVQREVVRVLDTITELTTELTAELTDELTARTKQYAYYRDELLKLEGVEGVEYIKLGNLSDDGTICLGRGNVISKKYLKDHFGPYPVYSSAQTNDGIIGYCNSYMFDDIRITWSIDGGGKFFYRDGQYSVTNVCGWCKVLREDLIIPKYLYYALSNAWTHKDYNYTHKAHPSTIKEEYIIPVPPLAVQQEVVRVLDTMTELTAELTAKLNAELPAREKQYAYYRDKMLSFPIKK